MTEAATVDRIFDELKSLKEDVTFIKDHLFDPDTVMTIEEGKRFEQGLQELKAGKTTPLSKMKKELGI